MHDSVAICTCMHCLESLFVVKYFCKFCIFLLHHKKFYHEFVHLHYQVVLSASYLLHKILEMQDLQK